jgi:hypothetical protein
MANDHEAELRRLEESLWRAPTRFDRSYMDEILAPEFFEFGRSGRVWSREDVLSSPRRPLNAQLPLPDFTVQMVSDDVALVTYQSRVDSDEVELGNRSSLWRSTDRGWKLIFHQGTPTRPVESNDD